MVILKSSWLIKQMAKKTLLKTYGIRKVPIRSNDKRKSTKTLNEIIAGLTLMTGLILGVFMVNLYRITIIDWLHFFYLSLIIALFLTLVTRDSIFIKDSFQNSNISFVILYYFITVGFTTSYLFLAINYYFALPGATYQSFQIKEKSSMPGGKGHRTEREPLVRFDYLGQEKELVFAYSQTAQVKAANRVGITIRKGKLGFDVIQSRELLN